MWGPCLATIFYIGRALLSKHFFLLCFKVLLPLWSFAIPSLRPAKRRSSCRTIKLLLLRYLAARLRHRDPAAIRYLNMGLGIEYRARRLAPFWAEHLARTRAAQARWAATATGEWLTVLGAGRLLDFNGPALLPRFAHLRLVDADPLCLPYWKKLKKLSDAICLDISACLDDWIAELRKTPANWHDMLQTIRSYGDRPQQAYSASSDALLSLNVLSQLPIVWQDGVEAMLLRGYGKRFVETREEEWLDALRPGAQALVEQHLTAIEASTPRFVLVITDVDYLEYKGKSYRRDQRVPPPVTWSPEGWCAEQGITCKVSPALERVDLSAATFQKWMPSYRLTWQECWLWHISPLGTEKNESGKVHRVGAFALERLCQ